MYATQPCFVQYEKPSEDKLETTIYLLYNVQLRPTFKPTRFHTAQACCRRPASLNKKGSTSIYRD